MRKIFKITVLILGALIALVVLLMLLGALLQKTYYQSQLESIEPYGEMVNVDGKNMHVYSMGSGEETIVVLAGHGIALPSADFGPLMRLFSKDYRVVLVEHLGTGFSDQTDKPRTCENYVHEMRTALKEAGVQPPYILMPHSISGIYSENYASKYPEEIKGIFSLDSSPTVVFSQKQFAEQKDFVSIFRLGKFLQDIGAYRILIDITSDDSMINLSYNRIVESDYTEKELNDYNQYRSFFLNRTMIEQLDKMLECVNEARTLDIPESVPVFKVISKEAAEGEWIGGIKTQENHLKRLNAEGQSVVLDGPHMIYYGYLDEIKKLADQFISGLE